MALLRPAIADLALNPDDILPGADRVRELEQIQLIQAIAAAQGGQVQGQQPMEQPMGEPAAPAPGTVAERRGAA